MKIKTRASSLPLALRCSASTVAPAIRIEIGDGEASRLGTGGHLVVLSRMAGTEDVNVEDVAAKLRVDPEELGMLVGMGLRACHSVSEWFPNPQIEVEMEYTSPGGLCVTGHCDAKSIVEAEIRVMDLKFGRVDSDYTEQLKGYCFLALQLHPECDSAFAMVVWVREQRTESARYTRQQMDEWFEQVETTLSDITLFSPGSHCGYCRRKRECPAYDLMLRKALEMVADGKVPEEYVDRRMAVGDLYHAAKLVEKEVNVALELVRAEVIEANGKLRIDNGRQLELIDQEQEKIGYMLGHDVIKSHLPPSADLDEIYTVGKGAFTKAVGDTAPPRMKKKFTEAAMESLRAAGAITTKIVTRLELRRNEYGTEPIATAIDGADATLEDSTQG